MASSEAPNVTAAAMNATEIFLIAMTIIFTAPYQIWRLGRTGNAGL
jgi:hypothetical protein